MVSLSSQKKSIRAWASSWSSRFQCSSSVSFSTANCRKTNKVTLKSTVGGQPGAGAGALLGAVSGLGEGKVYCEFNALRAKRKINSTQAKRLGKQGELPCEAWEQRKRLKGPNLQNATNKLFAFNVAEKAT